MGRERSKLKVLLREGDLSLVLSLTTKKDNYEQKTFIYLLGEPLGVFLPRVVSVFPVAQTPAAGEALRGVPAPCAEGTVRGSAARGGPRVGPELALCARRRRARAATRASSRRPSPPRSPAALKDHPGPHAARGRAARTELRLRGGAALPTAGAGRWSCQGAGRGGRGPPAPEKDGPARGLSGSLP